MHISPPRHSQYLLQAWYVLRHPKITHCNLTIPQPPILINRFLVDLRQLDRSSTPQSFPAASLSVRNEIRERRSDVLTSMIGNIGESLDYGMEEGRAEDFLEAPSQPENGAI